MSKYVHQNIEDKWVKKWEKDKTYSPKGEVNRENKQYILGMFPYPSGEGLHVGHVRIYTGTDVLARYHRMKGKHVIFPMGWDAFGLPAENAAVKAKKNPMDMVPKHIANFKRQMKMMGFSYDWNREVSTIDPAYYKWTQWIFLKLWKNGLAYKKEMPINWCPKCKIGLANEEVVNGKCERCGTSATRKNLNQWLLRITKYADRLLNGLGDLDWPDSIKRSQINWIGKSKGLEESWQVESMDLKLKTFTTWPHTSWGSTFMVIAPEHPIIEKLVKGTKYEKKAKEFCEKVIQEKIKDPVNIDKTKKGLFIGRYVLNHLNGRRMPIYVANFVVYDYGTGIIKCTPAHDERDFEFAKKYKLDILPIIHPEKGKELDPKSMEQAYIGEGTMVNAGKFNKMPTNKARKAIGEHIVKKGNGKWIISYKIRDWIFSRQHYWGEPIPIVYCKKCGTQAVLEKDLPVLLPKVKNYEPTETGESPLANIKEWVNTKCPKCKGPAYRETDTMPNWAGSCWYFLRFADPKNTKEPFSKESMKKLLPVDMYLGGAEHAVLHLLYSRFWVKAMKDFNLLNFSEPFSGLRNIGMVLAIDNKKMSKSLGNIINPDGIVEEYGADSLRIYEMFMAPFSQENAWSIRTLQGGYRFLTRVWRIYRIYENKKEEKHIETKEEKELISKLGKTIEKVEKDILKIKYNTSIAFLMEFLNDWEKNLQEFTLSKYHAKQFLQILAPFAPFITEEIWHNIFNEKTSIHMSYWPKSNGKKTLSENINIPVQVNGKVRVVLTVPTDDISEESVVRRALEESKIRKYIEGRDYKIIYVKGRILNFVV